MPHVQLASALLYKPAQICLTLNLLHPLLGSPNQSPSFRSGTAKPKATLPTILRHECLAAFTGHFHTWHNPYFTDGSVSEYGAAGAAFVCERHIHSCRITDGVSPFSKLNSLPYNLPSNMKRNLRDGAINIFTDSLSSLEALDHPP
ncbi:hypothetical protein GWK47_003167 [Chionoecetes opilio]|uniref:Uncharacterized protein n=1 Tax=Chionoecetes opilio TaxID=41210 RepID=A0A8J8W9M2_CHIOP|nr:hypothetical protein GWK47_003167 [Chionoecetes opilio]